MFNHSLTSAYFTYSSCFVCFICFACFALDMAFISVAYAGEKEFKEYLSQAKTLKEGIGKVTTGFAPEKIFDGYNSNPEPAKYYSEDSASASQTLKSDSISSLAINKNGQAIAESSKSRPQFKINQESEEIKGSKKIQTLASKNLKGAIEGFLSGEEEQVDTKSTKYVIKTCNEEIRVLNRVCTKSPVVKIINQPYQETRQYSGTINRISINSGNITVPVSGVLTSISLQLYSYSYNPWLMCYEYNGYLQGTHVSACNISGVGGFLCYHYPGPIYFKNDNLNINVNANSPISFSFSGYTVYGWRESNYSLTIKANLTKQAPEISWQEICKDI